MLDPSIGRWTTQDPLFPESGANPYEYCGNNPTDETDPSGLVVTLKGNKQTADQVYDLAVADFKKRGFEPTASDISLFKAIATGAVASGTSYDAETPQQLVNWVLVRVGAVRAAQEQNARTNKLQFDGNAGELIAFPGSTYWESRKVGEKTVLALKPGLKEEDLSKAMAELLENKAGLKADCLAAITILYLEALFNTIGPAEYAKQYGLGTAIIQAYAFKSPSSTEQKNLVIGSGQEGLRDLKLEGLIPGDRVVWESPALEKTNPYYYENSLYLGKNDKGEPLFYAHPFGILTQDALVAGLKTINKNTEVVENRPYGVPISLIPK